MEQEQEDQQEDATTKALQALVGPLSQQDNSSLASCKDPAAVFSEVSVWPLNKKKHSAAGQLTWRLPVEPPPERTPGMGGVHAARRCAATASVGCLRLGLGPACHSCARNFCCLEGLPSECVPRAVGPN